MLHASKSLAVAIAIVAFLASCGGDDTGSNSGLPCADSPGSSACADCKLKAKLEVCEEAFNARLVACQACNPPEPGCDAVLCAAKEKALQRCWETAAASLCGSAITGTGGSGGVSGSGGSGGSGGNETGGSGGDGGGSGGSGGGTGGSGGGTGGAGGQEVLCGGIACSEGQICNESTRPPSCECTSTPDSCEPYGMVCSGKSCVDRPAIVHDFDACDTPLATTEVVPPSGSRIRFMCMELNDGKLVWIRTCNATSQCHAPSTICDLRYADTVVGSGLCTWNFCGDSSVVEGRAVNGTSWGACDPTTKNPSNPTSAAAPGTCVPIDDTLGLTFQCLQSGQRPAGSQCRFDAKRAPDQLCERGTVCIGTYAQSDRCSSDAGCDETQVCKQGVCRARGCSSDAQCGRQGFCDSRWGFCSPLGTCTKTCNAGIGPDSTPFGKCQKTSDVCWAANGLGLGDDALGICDAPGCDLFGGPDECPAVGGKPGMCRYFSWTKGHAGMGRCGVEPSAPLRLGDECLNGPECEQGTLCLGSEARGYHCMPLCECPGAAWDDGWSCVASSPQCKGGQSCNWWGAGASLGYCD